MAKRQRDPVEEKVRDYTKQRHYAYGENNKSSRKAIRFRKAWVNRSYRRTVHQAAEAEHDPDFVTDAVQTIRRKDWKKYSDLALAHHVEFQLNMGARRYGPDRGSSRNHPAPRGIRKEALRRLEKSGELMWDPPWLR
jgi:hypothetical protein